MRIYLVRHGESVATGDDNLRPLNKKGKEDIQFLAHFLKPLRLQVAHAFHSEKQRAKETAEILATSFILNDPLKVRPELDPLASVNVMFDEINSLEGDTLLVGHMPFMGSLLSELVTGAENNNIAVFKAGSMVCLQKLNGLRWAIQWMLTPELFV